MDFITRIGRSVGGVVGTIYQAGRETIDVVIGTILPFIAFISVIIGIILYDWNPENELSSIGDALADVLAPLAESLVGLVILSIIIALPFLSPVLGPGAVIAQVIGTLLGTSFASGDIDPQYALPALFAINPQVGCDFIPVGLALGEAEPETVELGVPAVLFSRLITGPLAVVIAFAFSVGLY
ncbi:MAG: PTS glucitol/sorbitol transporter subunit IIB [Euzebya tangerina]|nr:PTS glucitol/sorbitol transporter subunit IIB [Euzebya tangerina]